jgi:hypothetical protein
LAPPFCQLAAAALVVSSLAVGLGWVAAGFADQADRAAAGRGFQSVDGLPLLPSVGENETRFLAFARRLIPAGAAVRIVQRPTPLDPFDAPRPAAAGVCGYRAGGLTYYWLVYALSPRPSTCDANAQWSVYYGVTPPAPPSGRRVYAFAPDYAVLGP